MSHGRHSCFGLHHHHYHVRFDGLDSEGLVGPKHDPNKAREVELRR